MAIVACETAWLAAYMMRRGASHPHPDHASVVAFIMAMAGLLLILARILRVSIAFLEAKHVYI